MWSSLWWCEQSSVSVDVGWSSCWIPARRLCNCWHCRPCLRLSRRSDATSIHGFLVPRGWYVVDSTFVDSRKSKRSLKIQNFLFLPISGNSETTQMRNIWTLSHNLFRVDRMSVNELNDVSIVIVCFSRDVLDRKNVPRCYTYIDGFRRWSPVVHQGPCISGTSNPCSAMK